MAPGARRPERRLHRLQRPHGPDGGSLDIKEFLDYLTENGHLPADSYVASVELGNEVMHGTGELWLKSYDISVE